MPGMWQTLHTVERARQAAAQATAARSRAAMRGHLVRRLANVRNVALRGMKVKIIHRNGGLSALVGQVDRLPGFAMRTARAMALPVYRQCREWSGREYFTLKELADRDHPYATRHGRGAAGIPDWIINRHRGNFHDGWEIRSAPQTGGARAYVTNTSDVAEYLRGTVLMRPRKIQEAAITQTRSEREQIVRDARRELREGRA